MVAALLGDHAEPALDQREVLPVLAEQQRGEPVVVEGEHELGRGILAASSGAHAARSGRTSDPCVRSRRAQRCQPSAGIGSRASATRPRILPRASAPNRLFALISVIVTAAISPIIVAGAMT